MDDKPSLPVICKIMIKVLSDSDAVNTNNNSE